MKTDTPFIRLCIPDYHPSGRLLLAHQSPSPWETGDPPKDIKSLSQHSLKRDMAVVFSLFDHLRIWKFQKYVLSYCMSILCFGLPLNMLLYVSFYVVLSYLFRSFHCVGRLSVKSGALDSMFSGFYAHYKHTVLRRFYEVPWCWFRVLSWQRQHRNPPTKSPATSTKSRVTASNHQATALQLFVFGKSSKWCSRS